MNENQVRRLLGDVAEQVPESAAPISLVAQRGQQVTARRRTRRRVGLLVGAAALVAVAAVITPHLLGGTDDSHQVAVQDPQTEEHSYKVGGPEPHQVALGRVVVTVPGSWTSDQPAGCLEVPSGGVVVSDLRVDCTTPDGDEPRTVRIAPSPSLVGPLEDLALTEVNQNGTTVQVQPQAQCGPGIDGLCKRRVFVYSEGVVVEVTTPADSLDQMQTVLESIGLLSSDQFAVPPGLIGQPLDAASQTLTRLGAGVGITSDGGRRAEEPLVTDVEPTAGTVLGVAEARRDPGLALGAEAPTGLVLLRTGPEVSAADVDLSGSWTVTLAGPTRVVGEEPQAPAPLVSTTITFGDGTVEIGRCATWRGDYATAGDEIRFTNFEEVGGRDCSDGAQEVVGTLSQVEHVTGRKSLRLHLESYRIVATLAR